MRDKLIELMEVVDIEYDDAVKIAKHFLANGILIPPCKIGDDIWWVNGETKTVECQKKGIKGVLWDGKGWYIQDTADSIDPIGTKWSCLTKEDAEKFLEGGGVMREILFRGKSNAGGWVYGVPLEIGEYCEICYFNSETMETEYYLVIPETIGQYTGLTDKSGKKIFEGDILKATDEKARTYIYKVVFINGIFGLVIKHGGYACPVVHWANNCIEVIGNIHDNPELLKGGEG